MSTTIKIYTDAELLENLMNDKATVMQKEAGKRWQIALSTQNLAGNQVEIDKIKSDLAQKQIELEIAKKEIEIVKLQNKVQFTPPKTETIVQTKLSKEDLEIIQKRELESEKMANNIEFKDQLSYLYHLLFQKNIQLKTKSDKTPYFEFHNANYNLKNGNWIVNDSNKLQKTHTEIIQILI